jgi:hypothetical protein
MGQNLAVELWTCGRSDTACTRIHPVEPAGGERLHRILRRRRDEGLNVEVFFALADLHEKLESWRQDYTRDDRPAPCMIVRRRASQRNGPRPRRPVRNPFRPGRESPQRAIYWRYSLESVERENRRQTGLTGSRRPNSLLRLGGLSRAGQKPAHSTYDRREIGVHANRALRLRSNLAQQGITRADRPSKSLGEFY